MSAIGTKRTLIAGPAMSAFGGKADIATAGPHILKWQRQSVTPSGILTLSGLWQPLVPPKVLKARRA